MLQSVATKLCSKLSEVNGLLLIFMFNKRMARTDSIAVDTKPQRRASYLHTLHLQMPGPQARVAEVVRACFDELCGRLIASTQPCISLSEKYSGCHKQARVTFYEPVAACAVELNSTLSCLNDSSTEIDKFVSSIYVFPLFSNFRWPNSTVIALFGLSDPISVANVT